jgi:Uma2 family endonuclease
MTKSVAPTSAAAAPLSAPDSPPANGEPFRYGWRFVRCTGPDGNVDLVQVPLTLEDVLHPQEGDVIPEIPRHEQERGYLTWGFRARRPGDPSVVIMSDCLINWGVEGLRNTSPDVSVFFDVQQQPNVDKGTFHVLPSGGRPVLAIELVSTDTRVNDVTHKVREYHQARVPLYVIVDQEREGAPREVIGYRHAPEGYRRIPLDDQGRLLLEPFGLLLGLRDNWVALFDAATGEEVGDYVDVCQNLKTESAARIAAEEATREHAAARIAAEERVRELENELRRLRGES